MKTNEQTVGDGVARELATRIMERFAGNEGHAVRTGHHSGIDYWSFEGIDNPEVIRLLGLPRGSSRLWYPQKGWMPLHEMVELVSTPSKFYFLKTLFENRDCIPRSELIKLWYICYLGKSMWSLHRQDVTNPQWRSTIINPLLIDNETARYNYVMEKRPGWRFLKCIMKRETANMKFSSALESAIQDDDEARFEMLRDMGERKICFTLLMRILNGKRFTILKHLIANDKMPKDVMSVEELCCFCVAKFPDVQSVPTLAAIEEARPGILKSVHDDFGRNLLWYAMFNKVTGWFHPNCALTQFLLKMGCDPDNKNQIGLSWREVTDGLTCQQKAELMRERYSEAKVLSLIVSRSRDVNFIIPPLDKAQPLKDLRKTRKKKRP